MKPRILLLLLILFAGSGFTALIYESIWVRYLKLVFGHTAYGQTLTLVLFLGGIGAGALWAGRLLPRIKSSFKAYIIAELVIAFGAYSFHPSYQLVSSIVFSSTVAGNLSPFLLLVVKLVLCSLITLPWAMAMGATFPFMASAVLRTRGDKDGWSLPLLYSANAAGGAAGILLAAFWMLSYFGYPVVLMIAGTINVLIALGCWKLSSSMGTEGGFTEGKLEAAAVKDSKIQLGTFTSSGYVRLLIGVTFLSSMASFIYEIGWLRLLALLLGASTHTFEIAIAVFIVGLAAGSLFSKWLISSFQQHAYVLGVIQILMGASALASLFYYKELFTLVNTHHTISKHLHPTKISHLP